MPNTVHLSYAIKVVGNVEKKIEHALRSFFKCRKWMPTKHLVNILTVCFVDPKLYVDPLYGKELRSM